MPNAYVSSQCLLLATKQHFSGKMVSESTEGRIKLHQDNPG